MRTPSPLARTLAVIVVSLTGVSGASADERSVFRAVVTFADNLLLHGRDDYGPRKTPLFVNQIDIETRRIPEQGIYSSRIPGRPGAGKQCCNLMWDCSLIRFMDALTDVTGDAKYSKAIDDYLGYLLSEDSVRQTRPNGQRSIPWGDHEAYNVVLDRAIGRTHEVKIARIPWAQLYQVNPEATVVEIEMFRQHVVDPHRSYAFSRHWPHASPRQPDCMNSSGGLYIAAWAFLYGETKNEKYLQWSRGLADYMWSLRHPATNLLASHPHNSRRRTRTEYGGPWRWFGPNLLYAAEEVGFDTDSGRHFAKQGKAYLMAYVKSGYDTESGGFYENFDLASGRPLGGPKRSFGELPSGSAAAFAYAYLVTKEPEFRRTADRMIVLFSDPDRIPGESYRGRAASLAQYLKCLSWMYEATGETKYLDRARPLVELAMRHHYRKGFFVGGEPSSANYDVDPGCDVWRLYSNRVGSAELALELLRYELLRNGKDAPIQKDVMF